MLRSSYSIIKRLNQLSVKIVYDSIQPFREKPPVDREQKKHTDGHPADLFSRFTADIINANILTGR
jgi:hypothetical protein